MQSGCGGSWQAVEWGMEFLSPDDVILPPPVRVFAPEQRTAPLVFASPHSGRAYPPAFVAGSRLDPLRLRRSEDAFVDLLFASVPLFGASFVTATFPRAFCDANREPWELDPGMFEDALPAWVNADSPRVAAGLGTLARVVASGEGIYRGRLRFAEAQTRVLDLWHPFHAALREEIAATRERFGACLLVDCHSMPGNSMAPRQVADVVLGDVHGSACDGVVMRRLEALLRGQGFSVRRNEPYAGGYITRTYGRPRERVHAVQIEVLRALYMDEERMEMLPGFVDVQGRLSVAMAGLARDAGALLGV